MKNIKLISIIIAMLLITSVMVGCSSNKGTSSEGTTSSGEVQTNPDGTPVEGTTTGEEDTNTPGNTVTQLQVTMNFTDSGCEISDTSAVEVSGKYYTVKKAGTYTITGTMADGQIRVDIPKTEKATLLFNNFTGSCSDSAVIYVMNADEVYIDLEKNSVNTLTDGNSYVFENPADDKPNACIYSSDDLTIKGGGTLNVTGNYNNGIGCKNDIDIKNGIVNVSAINNAVKGNDSITVRGDAVVNVLGGEDALKSDETVKADKGFIHIIEEAKVTITCTDDALQATQNVTITTGATLTVNAASTDINCDGTINVDDGCIINNATV